MEIIKDRAITAPPIMADTRARRFETISQTVSRNKKEQIESPLKLAP